LQEAQTVIRLIAAGSCACILADRDGSPLAGIVLKRTIFPPLVNWNRANSQITNYQLFTNKPLASPLILLISLIPLIPFIKNLAALEAASAGY